MKLSLCGISYKSSSLQERERLQINRARLPQAVKECLNIDGVIEAAVITTCNRIEFYLVLDNSADVFDIVAKFYDGNGDIDIRGLSKFFYTYQGSSVARHLFKVSSGADSMVIGETQILGQVKEAYRASCSVKGSGKILHNLFHFAFRAAKKIRTETEIGKGSVSVSGAAMEMFLSGFKPAYKPKVLCIGIGPMIEIAIKQLLKKGINDITIANRTVYKAEKFGNRFKVNYIGLDGLGSVLGEVDVVISATGSDSYIIDSKNYSDLLGKRNGSKIVFIDMAVPRDIDPKLGIIEGVKLLDLEDIKYHISHNRDNRENAVVEASLMVEKFVDEFMAYRKSSAVEPLIKELLEEMESIRLKELDESKRKIPVEQWDELERLSQSLLKKIVDLPIRRLKELNESDEIPVDPIDLFRQLFKLKSIADNLN